MHVRLVTISGGALLRGAESDGVRTGWLTDASALQLVLVLVVDVITPDTGTAAAPPPINRYAGSTVTSRR